MISIDSLSKMSQTEKVTFVMTLKNNIKSLSEVLTLNNYYFY